MISPMTNARRRPIMSPILAPVRMSMAMTRQYRVMIAWTVVTVVWKSWTSALIETFITDWSSTIRNCAVAKATSASQPFFAVASFTFPLRCCALLPGTDRLRKNLRSLAWPCSIPTGIT